MKLWIESFSSHLTKLNLKLVCSTMVEQILEEQALASVQPDITMKPLLTSSVCRGNQNGLT